jgi:hypothetical protein
MPPTTQIRIRRDTAANFTSANPTLALGEIAYETDTRNLKVGDGATAWTSLPYINPYRAGTAAAPTSNTVLGSGAGASLQSNATENTIIGTSAGAGVSSGSANILIGGQAGGGITTAGSNVVAGFWAGQFLSGTSNTILGTVAGRGMGSGARNAAVGEGASQVGSGQNDTTAVGYQAAHLNTANDTVAIGSGALDANTTGASNTAIGRNALGANTQGSNNTAVGHSSGASLTTGTLNSALGLNALGAGQDITQNTAIGYNALSAYNSTGNGFNVAVGSQVFQSLGSGINNTAIGGYAAASLITSGSGITVIGSDAASKLNAGTALTAATNSVFIGFDARANGNSESNQVVIAGSAGRGNGSNTTTIGNSSTTKTWLAGDLLPGQSAGLGTSGFLIRATGSDNGRFIGATVNIDANFIALRSNDGNTNQLTVNATGGNVTVSQGNLVIGTSGKGIDFSATSEGSGTMTSELLADYEEGTFTPTVASGITSVTYSTQSGAYTKIGRVVHYVIRLGINGGTKAAANLLFGGLPFTSNSSAAIGTSGAYFTYTEAFAAATVVPYLYQVNNSTQLTAYTQASPPANFQGTGIDAATSSLNITIVGSYTV